MSIVFTELVVFHVVRQCVALCQMNQEQKVALTNELTKQEVIVKKSKPDPSGIEKLEDNYNQRNDGMYVLDIGHCLYWI